MTAPSQIPELPDRPEGQSLRAAIGSAPPDVLRLWVAEYEDRRGQQWRTVVEAYTLEAAKRQFRRDNPDVELLTCY
jgi:adenosyl cobinamide kinase/adenosyl cobinamide phosphate guanylyltransferase